MTHYIELFKKIFTVNSTFGNGKLFVIKKNYTLVKVPFKILTSMGGIQLSEVVTLVRRSYLVTFTQRNNTSRKFIMIPGSRPTLWFLSNHI